MPFLTLITEDARTVLEVTTTWTEDRNNVPNNNYIKQLCPLLEPTAAAAGIDLDVAKYTFSVVKSKDGYKAYQPFVATRSDVAGIVWGDAFKPLSEIAGLTLEQDKDRPVFCVEVGDELVKFPIMFPKGASLDYNNTRKAFRAGNLAELLSKGFEKGQKLATLEPGDYSVTAIRESVFKGEVNYEVFIDGKGWFKTNSKMRRKIEAGIKVSPEAPAQLSCHGQVDTTSQGHPVIGVDFLSKHELDLPAFVF